MASLCTLSSRRWPAAVCRLPAGWPRLHLVHDGTALRTSLVTDRRCLGPGDGELGRVIRLLPPLPVRRPGGCPRRLGNHRPRSPSTFWIGGTTNFAITPSTIRKMARTKKKVPLGMRKLLVPLFSRQHGDAVVPHRWLGRARRSEHEQRHEGQVDEVGRFHQTDGDEERGEEPPCASGCQVMPEIRALPRYRHRCRRWHRRSRRARRRSVRRITICGSAILFSLVTGRTPTRAVGCSGSNAWIWSSGLRRVPSTD